MNELLTSIAAGYLVYSIVKFQRPSSISAALETLRGCSKCLAFWGTLVGTQDIKAALLASLTALILDSYIVTKL